MQQTLVGAMRSTNRLICLPILSKISEYQEVLILLFIFNDASSHLLGVFSYGETELSKSCDSFSFRSSVDNPWGGVPRGNQKGTK